MVQHYNYGIVMVVKHKDLLRKVNNEDYIFYIFFTFNVLIMRN